MDEERQERSSSVKEDLSFNKITEHVKDRVNQPTITVTLIIFFILNVIMVIVGFMYMKDCPRRNTIPIYLMVAGIVGIVSKVLPFINRKLKLKVITVTIYILYLFEFIWTIVGSYWVYSTHNINFDQSRPPRSSYCNKTAYYLAFWLLTVHWMFIGITLIVMCCACICFACMKE